MSSDLCSQPRPDEVFERMLLASECGDAKRHTAAGEVTVEDRRARGPRKRFEGFGLVVCPGSVPQHVLARPPLALRTEGGPHHHRRGAGCRYLRLQRVERPNEGDRSAGDHRQCVIGEQDHQFFDAGSWPSGRLANPGFSGHRAVTVESAVSIGEPWGKSAHRAKAYLGAERS
jgi:hypothetical protein